MILEPKHKNFKDEYKIKVRVKKIFNIRRHMYSIYILVAFELQYFQELLNWWHSPFKSMSQIATDNKFDNENTWGFFCLFAYICGRFSECNDHTDYTVMVIERLAAVTEWLTRLLGQNRQTGSQDRTRGQRRLGRTAGKGQPEQGNQDGVSRMKHTDYGRQNRKTEQERQDKRQPR